MSSPASTTLKGLRVLVAEDEFLVALEIADYLADAGGETIGPAGCVADALRLLEDERLIDAALLDVNLRDERIWPVVDILRQRGVPVVLTSGYDSGLIPDAYSDLPHHEKPVRMRSVISSLTAQLGDDHDRDHA